MSRTYLTANQDFYVSSSGSDSTGDGSSGNPWATVAKAYSYTQRNLDLAGQWSVNCYLQTDYTANDVFEGPLVGAIGPQSFLIRGTAADCSRIDSGSTFLQNGAMCRFRYLAFQPTPHSVTVTDGVAEFGDIYINTYGNDVIFEGAGPRAKIRAVGPVTIVGVGQCKIVFNAETGSQIELGQSFTGAGAPTWTTAFVQADLGGRIDATGFNYGGGGFPTGSRYVAALQGIIWTGGSGGANFFPGSSAGNSTGGYYG